MIMEEKVGIELTIDTNDIAPSRGNLLSCHIRDAHGYPVIQVNRWDLQVDLGSIFLTRPTKGPPKVLQNHRYRFRHRNFWNGGARLDKNRTDLARNHQNARYGVRTGLAGDWEARYRSGQVWLVSVVVSIRMMLLTLSKFVVRTLSYA